MKCIYFFGDSLTLGVNDPQMKGWTGRFGEKALETAPALTLYNLGVRKHSSLQVKTRWESEFDARILDGAEEMIVFCFGTVDMAAPTGSPNVPVEESVKNAREILTRAKEKAGVLMISPPPVANPEHTGRIRELSEAYQSLCAELNVPFFNMLPELTGSKAYMDDLADGVHPGAEGCKFFAKILMGCDHLTEWLSRP